MDYQEYSKMNTSSIFKKQNSEFIKNIKMNKNKEFSSLFYQKLKQQLRKKQDKKITAVYGRQSPVHGDHSAINKNTQVSLAIPIPMISKPTEFPQRRSLEALNSEIQTLVLKSKDQTPEKVQFLHFIMYCFIYN